MYQNKRNISTATEAITLRCAAAMHDLDLTVNMLGLCDPSNLLFVYPPRSDALFSNYFQDLFCCVVVITGNCI